MLARVQVDAVAVCYLHAYRNPRHERLTARALARRLRGVYVSLSSVVLPQIKEYERIWTTVVNAYVGPALARYLNALRARLAARGYRGDVLIMQSHGGVAPIRESARLAARSEEPRLNSSHSQISYAVFCLKKKKKKKTQRNHNKKTPHLNR